LLNPAHARALGEAGRVVVREHFNEARMAREVLAAFESVTNFKSPIPNRQS
jgi:hypothetical protein